MTDALNAAGRELNPSVRAIINIRNRGTGIPDGGLFTADQLRRGRGGAGAGSSGETAFPAQLPARGAVEVKGVDEEVGDIVRTEQVGRYLDRYGQVLVTSYREFVLVGRDRAGRPEEIESFSLADNAEGFWSAARTHRATAAEKGPGLAEFLKRAMLHGAPLSQPRDLAWFLASHAREALALVEGAGSLPALSEVREALREALGVDFEGESGEHQLRPDAPPRPVVSHGHTDAAGVPDARAVGEGRTSGRPEKTCGPRLSCPGPTPGSRSAP